MDSQFRPTEAPFELQRAQIAQALAQPLLTVAPIGKRKDLLTRFVPGVVCLAMHQFIVQRAEEALCHRIVVAVAASAHTRPDAEGAQLALVRATALLCTLVRVTEQAWAAMVRAASVSDP